jgi:hypothetical protein
MQDAGPAEVEGGRVEAARLARAGGLHAHQANGSFLDEMAEGADGIGASAHAGDHQMMRKQISRLIIFKESMSRNKAIFSKNLQ